MFRSWESEVVTMYQSSLVPYPSGSEPVAGSWMSSERAAGASMEQLNRDYSIKSCHINVLEATAICGAACESGTGLTWHLGRGLHLSPPKCIPWGKAHEQGIALGGWMDTGWMMDG